MAFFVAGRAFVAVQLGCDGKLQLRLGSLQALIGIASNAQEQSLEQRREVETTNDPILYTFRRCQK